MAERAVLMPPPRRVGEFYYREFQVLIAQDDGRFRAIARDAKGQQVDEVSGNTVEEVKTDLKARLNDISQDFFNIKEAIDRFKTPYPDGFRSASYAENERNYKDRTANFMARQLSEERLTELLSRGDYEAIGALATQALSTSNLAFPNEQMALRDALKSKQLSKPFAEKLLALIYRDFDAAINGLARLLRPHGAAKWPILTFWPFFRFPDRHMFLKPTVAQKCAHRLGYQFDYDPLPNHSTYRPCSALLPSSAMVSRSSRRGTTLTSRRSCSWSVGRLSSLPCA